QTTRPTVLVDLDHYRFSFVNPPDEDHNLEFEMSASDILIGLRLGFDVIFDGNFTAETPDLFLDKLLRAHPEETYLFYFDASLEETLKRHETKAHPRIVKEKMIEVYPYASPTGDEQEVIIPQDSSLEQTIEHITKIVGI